MEKCILRLIVLFLAAMTAMISGGCARKVYVEGETRYVNRVDTLWHERVRQDSVVLRDSVLIEILGDTIKQTVVRERWRTRTLTDTLRILSRDTVRVSVNQSLPISLPSKSEKIQSFFSGLITFMVIAAAIWLIYRKRR